jgi:hypothetical protein
MVGFFGKLLDIHPVEKKFLKSPNSVSESLRNVINRE